METGPEGSIQLSQTVGITRTCVKQQLLPLSISKTYLKGDLKRPRLNILRTFEAAGRRLSFSAAAKDLNISQAAVSQQIRQLEAYLDAPLFIRHNRKLSLTSKGQAYLDTVHEALERLDTVTDQLFPGRSHQIVTLRCTSSVAALWVAPEIKSLYAAHPEIELRLTTLDQTLDNDQLSHPDLEIFIAPETGHDPNADKLLTATILPVCSPRRIEGQGKPAMPADLLNQELIHVIGYEHDWHRWFHQHTDGDIELPRGLTVDGSLIAIEAAQRGDGVMLGRRPFIDRHLQSGELVEVFDRPFALYTDYHLRLSSTTHTPSAVKAVAAWLNALADQ